MVLLNLIPGGFYHGNWEGQEISFLPSPMYSTVESACNKFSSKKKMSSDLLVEGSVCQWFDCGKQLPPVSDLCLLGGCLQKVQLS